MIGFLTAKCWPTRSKPGVVPCGPGEGLGLVVPRVVGTVPGWFHRAVTTIPSWQLMDNGPVAIMTH
ncbi:hypothetical protein ACS0TY_020134 [Phlomoides rotata]